MRNWVKLFMVAVAIFSFTTFGCGGGGGESASSETDEPNNDDTPEVSELLSEIEALEESGAIPKLDRSDSLAGSDSNSNGIRDDIEQFISSLEITTTQKQAVSQVAQAFQSTLTIDLNDASELAVVGQDNLNALNCLAMRAPDDWPSLLDAIEAVTANTKNRTIRYIDYNIAQSGSISRLPDGDTCENNS